MCHTCIAPLLWLAIAMGILAPASCFRAGKECTDSVNEMGTPALTIDADNDGKITNADEVPSAWGQGSHGAIVLVSAEGQPETRHEEPWSEMMTPMRLEQESNVATLATLKCGDEDRGCNLMRIYIRVLCKTPKQGPYAVVKFGVAFAVEGPTTDCLVEGIKFAEQLGDNRLFSLEAEIDGKKSKPVRFRLAPCILLSNADRAEKVFSSTASDYPLPPGKYSTTVTMFENQKQEKKKGLTKFAKDLGEVLQDTEAEFHTFEFGATYIQDAAEVGYQTRGTRASTSRCALLFPVRVHARTPMLKTTFGVWPDRVPSESRFDAQVSVGEEKFCNFNAGGNLEVTPPFADYPYGRAYIGGIKAAGAYPPMNLPTWVAAQGMQSPFYLDTSWLTVGHVDELVSFTTGPDGKLRAIVPDPELGRAMLIALTKAMEEGCKVETAHFDMWTRFLNNVDRVVPLIAKVQGQIWRALGSAAHDKLFVGFPMVFANSGMEFKAAFPNFVNHISWPEQGGTVHVLPYPNFAKVPATPECEAILPKSSPVRDVFQVAATQQLEELGHKVKWVDDTVLHAGDGEVHCGTQVLRQPHDTALEWWSSHDEHPMQPVLEVDPYGMREPAPDSFCPR